MTGPNVDRVLTGGSSWTTNQTGSCNKKEMLRFELLSTDLSESCTRNGEHHQAELPTLRNDCITRMPGLGIALSFPNRHDFSHYACTRRTYLFDVSAFPELPHPKWDSWMYDEHRMHEVLPNARPADTSTPKCKTLMLVVPNRNLCLFFEPVILIASSF